MNPQSLLPAIRALGGINIRELRDLSGDKRAIGRMGPRLFRKPAVSGSGLKCAGFGLDELIPRLTERGFYIDQDDADGGVSELRAMIRAELMGEKVYSFADIEGRWEAEREHELEIARDNRRKSRLLELAQDLRAARRQERKAA